MADLTRYTGLCEAVADYLGRDDLADRIPTFISACRRRMNRELRLRVMERRAETAVRAGQSAVLCRGAGSRQLGRLYGDAGTSPGRQGRIDGQLCYVPPDTYGQRRAAGLTAGYTIIGRDLFLLPPPDADGTCIHLLAEIERLARNSGQRGFLLTALICICTGRCGKSGPFTRGASLGVWTQYYGAARQRRRPTNSGRGLRPIITMSPVRWI
jgi:hypothetical protein